MDDFAQAAPSNARVELVDLPQQLSDYHELAAHFAQTLRLDAETVLVAESYSGPLAILLAAQFRIAALVLCNTFARAPYPSALSRLPLSLIARIPPPASLIRYFVIGTDASDALVNQVRAAIEHVPAKTFADRAVSALRVDATRELARCTAPILCLRGTRDHVIRKWSLNTIESAATAPVTIAKIDAPHLLLKTAPREAWRAIDAFLRSARVEKA